MNFKYLYLLFLPCLGFSQGANLSLVSKSKEPVIISNDTLKVNQEIKIGLGSNTDGSYKFVQLVNNFNEPIKQADSRAALMKQKIKFFKEKDGVNYLFTKYFAINIEAAILSKEIIIE